MRHDHLIGAGLCSSAHTNCLHCAALSKSGDYKTTCCKTSLYISATTLEGNLGAFSTRRRLLDSLPGKWNTTVRMPPKDGQHHQKSYFRSVSSMMLVHVRTVFFVSCFLSTSALVVRIASEFSPFKEGMPTEARSPPPRGSIRPYSREIHEVLLPTCGHRCYLGRSLIVVSPSKFQYPKSLWDVRDQNDHFEFFLRRNY